ncbi:MAG: hypothetical protein LC118_01555 [Dehalococcoidia bacterium]|nr:hypothetical protein [Dehalococcoidia bacterium]
MIQIRRAFAHRLPVFAAEGRDADLLGHELVVVEDPCEIWAGFARNELTGKVELRRRYVKLVEVEKKKVVGLVFDAVAGQWVSFDLFRGGPTGAKNLRRGLLIWGRS